MKLVSRSICSSLVLGAMLFTAGRMASAQSTAELHVSAANAGGTRIAGARATVTNEATGEVSTSITGPDGSFDLTGLAVGTYDLAVSMQGMADYQQKGLSLAAGQDLQFQVTLRATVVNESVNVTAEGSPETSVTEATISRAEIMGVAGPFGSAAQALTAAPGVFVYGYGGVAATARSEVVVRGVKAGWSSVNGDILRNGVTFLFDGIPMNNMISNNGQWQTTQIPILDMINDISVDYGPGAPSNRWFDSIGGTVNYIPARPKETPGATIAFGTDYGSYNTSITHFIANTGSYKGWSGLLAAGYAANNTFRVGTPGIPTYNAPSSGYSAFTKVEHSFANGTISLGYYHSRNTEFRPNFLPLVPITPASNNNYGDAVTTTGLYGTDQQANNPAPPPSNAVYYSQATSGFYSSLNHDLWYKHIKTQSDILYGKLSLQLSPKLLLSSDSWFRHGYRLHDRVVNFYGANYAVGHELYDPTSNTIGNNTHLVVDLPHDQLTVGGYWMHGDYQNPVSLFNPAQGTSIANPAFFNSDHLYNDYAFLFVQDRIDLLHKKLVITPGGAEQLFRTDYFNNGLAEYPAGNPASDPNQAPPTHKNFLKFSPSVGAQYLTTNWLTLHGNFAITYQNPTDSAFGANRPTTGVNIAQLKPTESQNLEGGFLITRCPLAILGSCSVDVTYFHDKLSNVNVVTQVAQVATPAAIALASSLLNGISFNFDTAPSKYLQVHGNGIVQHDYFLSYIPNGSQLNFRSLPISNTPGYTTNLGLTSLIETANHKLDLTPGLWWQYVSYRYLFTNVTNAPTNLTTPGYGVVNFSLEGGINRLLPEWFTDKPVKLSLGIDNLLGKQYNPTAYITSGGYFGTSFGGYTLVDPGAPREFIVSVNFGSK